MALEYKMKQDKREQRFVRRKHVIWIPSFNNTRYDSTPEHNQMINIEIRLIILFATKDGGALYSQKTQDWELAVAQIMNSLLANSD